MKAVAVRRYGGPEALELLDLPEPHAGRGEVRIRVRAVSVNPADTLVRTGAAQALMQGTPPHILGLDAAGVVDEVGEGTTLGLAPGDRVLALVNPTRPAGGSYAQWVVLPETYVVRAPAGSSHPEASTLPLNGLTARLALDKLALPVGRTVAVTGAAGGVGGYVIQLAKADGLFVVADASPTDMKLVAALGADVVVERGGDVAARILESVPTGADAAVDAALIGRPVLSAIRTGGALAVVRSEQTGLSLLPERGITFHDVFVHDYDGRHDILDRLSRQAEAGELSLRVARTFSPEDAADAHRTLEAGGVRGRLVIEF